MKRVSRCDVVLVIVDNRRWALHSIAPKNSIRHIDADLATRRRHGCAMLTTKPNQMRFQRELDAVVHTVGVQLANSSIEIRYRFVNRTGRPFPIKNVIRGAQHTILQILTPHLVCFRHDPFNCK